MISMEVVKPSLRRQLFYMDIDSTNLAANLDLPSELRDWAQIVKETCKIKNTRI